MKAFGDTLETGVVIGLGGFLFVLMMAALLFRT
jgi:hypothetical protein